MKGRNVVLQFYSFCFNIKLRFSCTTIIYTAMVATAGTPILVYCKFGCSPNVREESTVEPEDMNKCGPPNSSTSKFPSR